MFKVEGLACILWQLERSPQQKKNGGQTLEYGTEPTLKPSDE